MSEPQPIYRKDYQPSAYLIRTTDLSFELFEQETQVVSKMVFYQNPQLESPVSELCLDGENLELISILIDGAKANYELFAGGLRLDNLANAFTLEIKTRIHPEKNTSLNGLYQSNGNFCSQCEAQGFRHISYYLDRPDVLSVFTTHIKADPNQYPVLLSNGNLVAQQSGVASWHDPSPKPCYLFALVAGDFAVLEDDYTTRSGNQVALKIYVEPHNINKTQFAMDSLKRAFAWDEARFGLEYDLDIYMIVAVDDFNMGAMENKGLNIFNSNYILADAKSATDEDFLQIESVIGHEYFHNWTGNRITCRDWFQLSLKEGLTVFRDQEFTSDLHARSIKRIEDVKRLRTFQFAEDSSPIAHPVRPESYIEMNNFYTFTVYEKGAELIRMMHTLLGEEGFLRGMRLYVQRHDAQAVTIEDFVRSMSDANDFDLKQFMPWYCQAGTPRVTISCVDNKITIYQKDRRLMPIKYGVLDKHGVQIEAGVLVIKDKQNQFDFSHLATNCTFSWLRDFSAPIKLTTELSVAQKIFLLKHDTDAFNRWDNAQQLWLCLILTPEKIDQSWFFEGLENVIKNTQDTALVAQILMPPSEKILHQKVNQIDVFAIFHQRENLIKQAAKWLKPLLLETYAKLNLTQKYQFTPSAVGNRALKNGCLYYLFKLGEFDLAYQQFKTADCMSDKLASFRGLINQDNRYKNQVCKAFFAEFKNDSEVMDKYFAALSGSKLTDVKGVKALMRHKLFTFNNPNRLRSVVASFTDNFINFHHQAGYEFLTEVILKLNQTNPQIGARLVATYNHWEKFTPNLQALQKQQLKRILATENLSKHIFEIVQAALK